jgi:hypothetical protein
MSRTVHRDRRRALLLATVIVLAAPVAAHADAVDHADWDTGYSTSYCSAETNSRTCLYDLYVDDCVEASAAGSVVAPCHVRMHAQVRVAPLLNSTGKVIGCTSSAGGAMGWVSYDSAVGPFDNGDIASPFHIDVYDSDGDTKKGIASFVAVSERPVEGTIGTAAWVVTGTLAVNCGINASSSSNTSSGTVDVYA